MSQAWQGMVSLYSRYCRVYLTETVVDVETIVDDSNTIKCCLELLLFFSPFLLFCYVSTVIGRHFNLLSCSVTRSRICICPCPARHWRGVVLTLCRLYRLLLILWKTSLAVSSCSRRLLTWPRAMWIPIPARRSSLYCRLELTLWRVSRLSFEQKRKWINCKLIDIKWFRNIFLLFFLGLMKFAADKGFSGEKFNAISLGQGQVTGSLAGLRVWWSRLVFSFVYFGSSLLHWLVLEVFFCSSYYFTPAYRYFNLFPGPCSCSSYRERGEGRDLGCTPELSLGSVVDDVTWENLWRPVSR